MSSKLLINVNDATPSVIIPDTGGNTSALGANLAHDNGVSMALPIIGIAVLSIAIIAGAIVAISRRKKVNRFTTHTNKHLVAKLTTLSVVVLLGVLGVLNADKLTSMVNATDNSEEDTLTITASDIKIDVDLEDTAVFATGESIVTVSSATEAGYTLMAYVNSTATDLTNETNKSSKSKIAMLSSNELAALTDNTWGIATSKPSSQDSAVFTGLPATQDTAITLKTTEEATTANDKSTFYYGTYITPDLDYGTYSGTTITYIAIANYAGPCNPNATTIQEAKCLQDFAGPNRDQIVDSMTPETQYTLMDMRDEKTYTIAMLHSGNISQSEPKSSSYIPLYSVWMTQNLDLDLDTNTTYTNKDTDLGYNPRTQQYETATWKPSLSTYATNEVWRDLFSVPESYDPGDVYWDIDETISSTGIPQYHLGNYYNWTAAVAMNNSSYYGDGAIVEQSICPAGWTLPRVGHGNDSFYSLWEYYGFGDDGSYWYGENDELHALWMEPLFFVASGYYDDDLEISSLGSSGYFWSSYGLSDSEAYSAYYRLMSGAGSSSEDYREYGQSVRCVARPVANEVMWSEE